MNIYVAAPWTRRDYARAIRDVLLSCGFDVTSRWLDVDETQTTPEQEAGNDLTDLEGSDTLLVLNLGQASEGKAFEQGYAKALDIPLVVVGDKPQNVFQHLPDIKMFPDIGKAIDYLREGLARE